MKTTKEQLQDLENTRGAKAAQMQAIMQKAADEGRSTSDEEAAEYDGIVAEVQRLDGDITRLRQLEKVQVQRAAPVLGATSAEAAAARSGNTVTVSTGGQAYITVSRNEEKGIAFARYARTLAKAKGNLMLADHIAGAECGDDPRIGRIIKAAIGAGSTASGNWAAALAGDENAVFTEFVEFLRPMTILGKFGANGIPGLTPLPFNVPIITQTGGGQGYWVGEGKAKPLTNFSFSRASMPRAKVANIVVLTEELVNHSNPSALVLCRNQLGAALGQRLDIDFVDPAKAATAVSPASITNGVAGIASAGATADDVRTDVKAVMPSFIAANNPPTTGVWIMSATRALALSMMNNALGQPEFSGVTMRGGTFVGLPLIVSEFVSPTSVVLANARDIFLGDEGGVQIAMSEHATLEMADNPTGDSATPTAATATSLVNMFQSDSIAVRAERFINWQKARASAVSHLTGAAWG